jgi:hypothetical protein
MNTYVIVRTYSAGCFAGRLVARDGKEVTLADARRLWSWQGATTLSQLASIGSSVPGRCKFAGPVDIVLTEAIEIITMTAEAVAVLDKTPAWTA